MQQQQHQQLRPHNVPPAPLNGGLYTGEPFKGPWGNVPVIPDVDYMTSINLRSANPPVEALMHYPGGPRAGNNKQNMPGVNLKGFAGGSCQTTPCPWGPCDKSKWAMYSYLN
jgi:hypothetical protein